eukprot:Gb_02884 [translate_table: standard]
MKGSVCELIMATLLNRSPGLGSRRLKGEGISVSEEALSSVGKMVRITNSKAESKCTVSSSCSTPIGRLRRYAVLGAGFAGISVTWHLLQMAGLSHLTFELTVGLIPMSRSLDFWTLIFNLGMPKIGNNDWTLSFVSVSQIRLRQACITPAESIIDGKASSSALSFEGTILIVSKVVVVFLLVDRLTPLNPPYLLAAHPEWLLLLHPIDSASGSIATTDKTLRQSTCSEFHSHDGFCRLLVKVEDMGILRQQENMHRHSLKGLIRVYFTRWDEKVKYIYHNDWACKI